MSSIKPLIDNEGEVRELTSADLERMKPLKAVMPKAFVDMALTHQAERERLGKIRTPTRGKQKAPTKRSVTIRLSPEVVEAFQTQGKGWQTRINEVLLAHIRSEKL